jgi:cell division transport system permease protein
LLNDYRVIVVADKTLDPTALKQASGLVASVERVDVSTMLHRIRRQVSQANLDRIEAIMPAFYTLSLRSYPDAETLDRLQKALVAVPGVRRVQLFENMHDRLYSMLLFMKENFFIFGGLLGFVSLLLVLKQMAIWQFEHQERMRVMALFGAPVWLRSGVLFRLAFLDAVLAWIAVSGTAFYLTQRPDVNGLVTEMGISRNLLLHWEDIGILASVSIGLALVSALWVVMRFKEE